MKKGTGRIAAIVINHNTSAFAEVTVRSLLLRQQDELDLSVTLLDNGSRDDTYALIAFADQNGIDFRQSGRCVDTAYTHGAILRDFVLNHSWPEYFLFLDSDLYFGRNNSLSVMLKELAGKSDVWALQARELPILVNQGEPSHDCCYESATDLFPCEEVDARIAEVQLGNPEISTFVHQFRPGYWEMEELEFPEFKLSRGRIDRVRCHVFCTLIRNTEEFRLVTREIGFSPAWLFEDGIECSGYYDTFGLATRAMRTHGKHYLISSNSVWHFGGVSYQENNPYRTAYCHSLLGRLRAHQNGEHES